jgi:hypothetical protein
MNRNRETARQRNGEDDNCFVAGSPVRQVAVSILLFLLGCSGQTGPDANTGVFKTPEEATAVRKQKLLLDWQEMAARIANAERPDVRTIKGPGFSLLMSAQGGEETVDLSPLSEKLASAVGREREPIRVFLGEKFAAFDRARLRSLGFERVRSMLWPLLVNMKQTSELGGENALVINRIALDLNWAPVVRWSGSEGRTAVDLRTLAAWKVSAEQVNAAATENLRRAFAKDSTTQAPFDTLDLPALGRYGTLRSGVDPSVLLLSELLAAVRREWKTDSDLVVSFPSRTTVNFVERKNEKLLSRMIPQWREFSAKVSEPMVSTPLLVGDGGISLFNYSLPATGPASAPATKPKPVGGYIVH